MSPPAFAGPNIPTGGVLAPRVESGDGRVVAAFGDAYGEAESKEDPMKTILVGTDTSAAADLAVEDAARLARERGAELLVLYVKPDSDLRSVVDPALAADPGAYLRLIASRFPGVVIRTRVETGDPAERICDVAEEERAEAIVLGNRGVHGTRWRVRDSIPNIVLRHSPCSVYIVDTRAAQ
jgi:nucleotide-binding universal stress UspA family protein